MTYFRYDNNKRGFDMSGIEWEIYNLEKSGSFTPDVLISVYGLIFRDNERYVTIITRNRFHVANLYEQDTARFVEAITEVQQGRPNVPRSCVETIERFLNPISANSKIERLWYMDGDYLKHRNAPTDNHYAGYVLERPVIEDSSIITRVLEKQPLLNDTELHMLHSVNNSSSVCVDILYKILNKDK